MVEEQRADQDSTPVANPETANTTMKIGLLIGIALIVAGGFLLFLNLTGYVTPSFVSANGEVTGLVQGGVLTSVGLVVTIIMVIGPTGPDEESTG